MQFSKSKSDIRRFERLRTLKSGRVLYIDGRSTRDCTIRDLTPLGARLKFQIPFDGPDDIILQIGVGDLEKARTRCKIVWRTSNEVGVSFEKELQI